MRQLKPILLLAISALLLTSTLSAQRATGQVFGTVNDDQGSPLPGVSITAKGPRLVGSAATVTNAQAATAWSLFPPEAMRSSSTCPGSSPSSARTSSSGPSRLSRST